MAKPSLPTDDEPEHVPQFRGAWFPGELFHYLREGKVKPLEAILLLLIDSHVDTRGDGCWASNRYLAQLLRCNPTHVSDMVQSLKKQGLVFQVGVKRFGGRDYRVLETCWSRLVPDATLGLQADGGPAHRPSRCSKNSLSENPSHCRGLTPGDATQEVDVFFDFPNNTNTPAITKKDTTSWDIEQATKLKDAVRTKSNYTKPISAIRWAPDFALLRKATNQDTARITKVLTWYCKNLGGPWIPQALCARAFREKFLQIEAAMGRNGPTAEDVEVSPGAEKVVEYVQDLGWPKGTKQHLSVAAELSLQNYHDFRSRLYKAIGVLHAKVRPNRSDSHSYRRDLAQHLYDSNQGGVHGFMVEYFRALHARVVDWDGWSGELRTMVFDWRGKWFDKHARGVVGRWCNEPHKWDELKELLETIQPE